MVFDNKHFEIITKNNRFFYIITITYDIKVITTLFDNNIKTILLPKELQNLCFLITTTMGKANDCAFIFFGMRSDEYRIKSMMKKWFSRIGRTVMSVT